MNSDRSLFLRSKIDLIPWLTAGGLLLLSGGAVHSAEAPVASREGAQPAAGLSAGPATFEKDEEVRLLRSARLFFNDKQVRVGSAGEVFTVLDHQPAAKKVFLLSKGADGKPVALNVSDDAVVRVRVARLSKAAAALLTAAADPFYLKGAYFPEAGDRKAVLANYADSPEPPVRDLAKRLQILDKLRPLVESDDAARAGAILNFAKEWRDMFDIEKQVENGIVNLVTGTDPEDAWIANAEKMARGLLSAKTRTLWLTCAVGEMHTSVRRAAVKLAAGNDGAQPSLRPAIAVSAVVDKGMTLLQVKNVGARPLHGCLVIGRRLQDTEMVGRLNGDRMLARMLTGAVASEELADDNDKATRLEIHSLGMEQGGLVYVPELAAGAWVTLPVSTTSGLNFTRSLEASLWCHEGIDKDHVASNLTAALKPYAGQGQPGYFLYGQPGGAGARPPAAGPAIPPSNSRVPPGKGALQPSWGLQPSGGL